MGDSYDGAERLVGAASVVKTYGWAETLVGDPAGLEADLAAFEYPDAEVSAVLRERAGIAEEVASIEAAIKEKRRWLSYAVNTPEIVRLEQERQSLFERFADLLSGRRVVGVEGHLDLAVRGGRRGQEAGVRAGDRVGGDDSGDGRGAGGQDDPEGGRGRGDAGEAAGADVAAGRQSVVGRRRGRRVSAGRRHERGAG